eukprot:705750-Rhodomonas_salina.4
MRRQPGPGPRVLSPTPRTSYTLPNKPTSKTTLLSGIMPACVSTGRFIALRRQYRTSPSARVAGVPATASGALSGTDDRCPCVLLATGILASTGGWKLDI